MDLKKAFDTVDCDIIIKKLNRIGISGMSWAWIKSYMSDRVCRTLRPCFHDVTERVKISNFSILSFTHICTLFT